MTAKMKIVAEGFHSIEDEDANGVIVEFNFRWQTLLCPSCERPALIQHRTCSEELDYDSDGQMKLLVRTTLLYPAEPNNFDYLPPLVGKSYTAALRLFTIDPNAFAVAIGRTLEFVFKDRNATGDNLAKQINDLAKRDEIPRVLAEMAHGLKFFRNVGAHADELEVSNEDAIILRDISAAILEYVYKAPSMVSQIQDRINMLKAQTSNKSSK